MAKNFYFAWVEPGTAFNPAVHNVEDEDVFSHEFSHEEGGFAALQIVIRNPRIGLLNPSRKRWAYFSFNKGTDEAPDIVPQFYGRLLGVPDNIFDTLVTLQFVARPSNFVAQKTALATTLKVLPYYDPIFVSPDAWTDPDAVLEGRTQLWHIDPVSHVVSVSDILVPEDGTVEFEATDVFYDSVAISLQSVPLRAVSVVATIPWTQSAQGSVDFKQPILGIFGGRSSIGSFSMEGLVSSWPQPGTQIGNGWVVTAGELVDISFLSKPEYVIPDVFAQTNSSLPHLAEGSIVFPIKVSGKIWGGVDGAGYDFNYELVGVAKGWGSPTLTAQYTAQRDFAEVVNFTLFSDQQAILTLPEDDEAMLVSLTANSVSDMTVDGSVPIGDVRSRTYVNSARGRQSVEHLIMIARAHLVSRSRAVQVSFKTDYVTGLQITLRKAALIHDDRIPGGVATGKVMSYKFSLDGDSGEAIAEITIGCAVGYGGSYTEIPGNPTYVDEPYVDKEYQEYESEVVLSTTSDVLYSMPPYQAFDDGLDFKRGLTTTAITHLSVANPAAVQAAAIEAVSGADQSVLSTVLQAIPTRITMQLVPMEGGPFVASVPISVSDLIVPKQIDLEAASV